MPTPNDDRPIRILHLSDIHFKADKAWDADPVLRDLAEFIAEEGNKGYVPDLVMITGDLAFAGVAEEYQLARSWLDEQLWPALPKDFPHSRLLLVPGNHDVDRKKVDFVAEAVQKNLLAARDQNQLAKVLGDAGQRDVLLKRHAAYLQFFSDWLGEAQLLPWWRRSIEIRGVRLHVAGLNSAWMACGEEDRGRLLLGRYQINQTVRDQDAKKADWRLALLHHPWDYCAEFDVHETRSTIHQHCDLLLRGHLHFPQTERVVPPDPNRACLELAAGCVYENSQYPNAFQWIELHLRPRRIKVLYRLYTRNAWTIDRNQPGCPDGEAKFDLSSTNRGGPEDSSETSPDHGSGSRTLSSTRVGAVEQTSAQAAIKGAGAIAQAPGAVAAGAKGIAVGGDAGNISMVNQPITVRAAPGATVIIGDPSNRITAVDRGHNRYGSNTIAQDDDAQATGERSLDRKPERKRAADSIHPKAITAITELFDLVPVLRTTLAKQPQVDATESAALAKWLCAPDGDFSNAMNVFEIALRQLPRRQKDIELLRQCALDILGWMVVTTVTDGHDQEDARLVRGWFDGVAFHIPLGRNPCLEVLTACWRRGKAEFTMEPSRFDFGKDDITPKCFEEIGFDDPRRLDLTRTVDFIWRQVYQKIYIEPAPSKLPPAKIDDLRAWLNRQLAMENRRLRLVIDRFDMDSTFNFNTTLQAIYKAIPQIHLIVIDSNATADPGIFVMLASDLAVCILSCLHAIKDLS